MLREVLADAGRVDVHDLEAMAIPFTTCEHSVDLDTSARSGSARSTERRPSRSADEMRMVLPISLVAVTAVRAQPASGVKLGPPPRFEAADLQVVESLCGGKFSRTQEGYPTCGVSKACEDQPVIVRAVYRGSFSAAGAREALVDLYNPCGAGTGGFHR